MCEQYMEQVTGYTAPNPTSMNHPSSRSSAGSSSENHFPTVPTRAPLSPSESRKLFLTYNQSLYDFPIRFNFAQKIDKDSELSKLYSRMVYLLFENNNGILNDTRSLVEFLKNDNNASTDPQKVFTESLISQQVKQMTDVITANGAPIPSEVNPGNYLLFRLCSKSLSRLKATQRAKSKRPKEAPNALPLENPPSNMPAKNLIKPTDFVRHRWKRSAYIPAVPSIDQEEENLAKTSGDRENKQSQLAAGNDETTGTPRATGSMEPMEGESGSTTESDTLSQPEKQGSGIISALSRTKPLARGSGYRLVKGHSSSSSDNKMESVGNIGEKIQQAMQDEFFYDNFKAPVSRRDASNLLDHEQSAKYGKGDVPMILTTAEGNLNVFMMNKTRKSSYNAGNQNSRKSQIDDEKHLEELFLGLEKNPRRILSMMEVALFNNWQYFIEASKQLSVLYQVDDGDTPLADKHGPLVWLSVRQKIMESLVLNMETKVFSAEIGKKAERRKRAIEQLYHDYSLSILGELKNVKEMPISRKIFIILLPLK